MVLAPGAWDANWSGTLAVDNIPNANLDLTAAGGHALDVLLVGARGGNVTLGAGDDWLVWVAHTNAPGAGNTLVINTGAGNDHVVVSAVGLDSLADGNRVGNGALYNPDYDGRYSVAEVHFGGGQDQVRVMGLTKLVVFTGDAVATAQGGGAGDAFLIGGGGGSFTGGGGADGYLFMPGSGNSTITDFTPGEDWMTFAGIPAGALAITAATQGGVAGTLVTFDAAGHSVFLAGVGGLNGSEMLFI
jgi:Ca2+-binding RTX toxin-like protein